MNSFTNIITIGARNSPLSKQQVAEVLRELQRIHPHIDFLPTWIETTGDKDLKTSLKTVSQSNFFTKEIDERQLAHEFRLSIHSAKDLPIPLPKGLRRIALTKGIDPRDVLVLRPLTTINSLPTCAKIATSSLRREEIIKSLRDDFEAVDVRGTIEKRLQKLYAGEVDGLIVAKAALIRLHLDHLNQIVLEGPTAKYQGQLAIIAKASDEEMASLLAPLDHAKVLYTGLTLPHNHPNWHHYPLIETIPVMNPKIPQLKEITHLIITSKTAICYLMAFLEESERSFFLQKKCISIGKATTACLESYGFSTIYTAERESSIGIIELLKTFNLENACLFWPHSAKSSSMITDFLQNKNIQFIESILYDTITKKSIPPIALEEFDEFFFTSPSTVHAFLHHFGKLPKDKILTAIGEITEQSLKTI